MEYPHLLFTGCGGIFFGGVTLFVSPLNCMSQTSWVEYQIYIYSLKTSKVVTSPDSVGEKNHLGMLTQIKLAEKTPPTRFLRYDFRKSSQEVV